MEQFDLTGRVDGPVVEFEGLIASKRRPVPTVGERAHRSCAIWIRRISRFVFSRLSAESAARANKGAADPDAPNAGRRADALDPPNGRIRNGKDDNAPRFQGDA